jgi:hypothetical protein
MVSRKGWHGHTIRVTWFADDSLLRGLSSSHCGRSIIDPGQEVEFDQSFALVM